MKIILREDVEKLGQSGEVVDVKDGYGRNYLIPQGKAVMATKGAIQELERLKKEAARQAEFTVNEAKELAKQLEVTSLTIPVTTGDEDKIHGTVTNADIAKALEERDILVEKKDVTLDQEVKGLGEYTATVSLVGDLKPQVKFWVVKDE
ncbi:50S ribosomal protein L9 [Gracilimonas amylolytica]|uniref:50S ribosomal protein L9 n=1 Tax=Gracilimonas amylolytica TaxID=1749045 RepID=UPI000CD87D06|nr:50S ribosomal protein L9 [Gracilimonas amylolytica]